MVVYGPPPKRPRGSRSGKHRLPRWARWTLAVLGVLLVVVLAAGGYELWYLNGVYNRVTKLTATPDLGVEVTGFQWGWRFRYPAQGITVVGDANKPPTLVLPVGANVRLRLIAADVVHSFFVPQFLVKKDMIPGVDNQLEIRPTQVGHYGGYCAEFCGLDHTRMTFSVEVVTPQQFQAFVAEQQPAPGGPGPDTNGPGDVGRQASLVR